MPKAKRPEELGGEEVAYVEVRDEPVHRQQYENPHCRVYVAGVDPGTDTMWHRHSEDTLYTCLRTVDALNKPIDKPEFMHHAKQGDVWWTMSKEKPFIHQVCMPSSMTERTWFHAVEVLTPPPVGAEAPLDCAGYALDESLTIDNKARVYRLKLAPGQSTGSHTWGFCALVLTLAEGLLKSEETGPCNSPFADGELSRFGAWKWVEGPVTFSVTNEGPGTYEAIVLELLQPAAA